MNRSTELLAFQTAVTGALLQADGLLTDGMLCGQQDCQFEMLDKHWKTLVDMHNRLRENKQYFWSDPIWIWVMTIDAIRFPQIADMGHQIWSELAKKIINARYDIQRQVDYHRRVLSGVSEAEVWSDQVLKLAEFSDVTNVLTDVEREHQIVLLERALAICDALPFMAGNSCETVGAKRQQT